MNVTMLIRNIEQIVEMFDYHLKYNEKPMDFHYTALFMFNMTTRNFSMNELYECIIQLWYYIEHKFITTFLKLK